MHEDAMRQTITTLSILMLFSSTLCAAGTLGDADATAILAEYGRPNGLCAVVCASKQTPASFVTAFAQKDRVVHVLTGDEAQRAKFAAATIPSACNGNVMIEKLELTHLPYVDNLVNLLVVDDMEALARSGVKPSELERVVTPGGTMALRKSGKWIFSRKPWPTGMDEWSHLNHDAAGNRVSTDKFVRFPFGYQWIDGAPVPEIYLGPPPKFELLKIGDCRGMVTANGRLFAVNAAEPENFGLAYPETEEYLVARDAFNGLMLWKQPTGKLQSTPQKAILVAGQERVYSLKDGKLTAFNASDGKVAFTCNNEHLPAKVLLSGSLLAVCWNTSDAPEAASIFQPQSTGKKGIVEGFDAATGQRRWTLPVVARDILAANDVLFALVESGQPAELSVLACDLSTGHERFRLTAKDAGISGECQYISAGKGYVLMAGGGQIIAVSASDGKALWKLPDARAQWGPVVDGQFWQTPTAYDVLTGKAVKDNIPRIASSLSCSPPTLVNNLYMEPKFGRFTEVCEDGPKYLFFRGARSGCAQGWTPAEGMLFVAPENCICNLTQPYGTLALASVGKNPTAAEFCAKHKVERGEAFGSLDKTAETGTGWSTYRGNPERSSSSDIPTGFNFKKRWETKVLAEVVSPLVRDSYQSRGLPHLGPPVYGNGNVFVAVADRGEIVALSEKTGTIAWRYRAGSRIETSPSIYRGGCFFGCNDGYIYGLRAKDGKLMWRVRLAPLERRMIEHGVVESFWPVYGSVLIYNGAIFAAAGRNSETDGGIVIAAFDPATGDQKWARHIDVVQRARNDVLGVAGGKVVWQNVALDPQTGDGDLVRGRVAGPARTGMWDTTNLYLKNKHVANTFSIDGKSGWQMAWNEQHIAVGGGDVSLRKADGTKRTTEDLFAVPGKATAVVTCPNAVIYGYGRSPAEDGRIVLYTYDNPESRDFSLAAGVVHNGIAVLQDGLVVAQEDGNVTFLEKEPVKSLSAGFSLRVNCGGKEFKDANGHVWEADREFKPGAWGVIGGGVADRSVNPRKKIQSPIGAIYLSERYGADSYRFTVPNGRYQVVLHFAETYLGDDMTLPNADLTYQHRRFDVSLNGVNVLRNFEPLREAGGQSFTPVVRQFATEVINGEIKLHFASHESGMEINGIEILGIDEAGDPAQAKPAAAVQTGPGGAAFKLRVNCGGKEFKDAAGNTWVADQKYSNGSWGFAGGNASDRSISPRKQMAGTAEPALYLTERYGLNSYRFTVPNGKYTVALHFCETYFGPGGPCEQWAPSNGPRRFSVTLNGARVLTDFNPLQEAGGANCTPVVKRFETEATDGQIEIRFTSLQNAAEINGIEIIGK